MATKTIKKKAVAKPNAVKRTATLYAVQYGTTPNSLHLKETTEITVGPKETLAPDISAMVSYSIGADAYLFTYSNKSHHYAIYKVEAGGAALTKTGDGELHYGKAKPLAYTIITPFILGGVQYIVAYEPKGGKFDYYALDGKSANGVADYSYYVGLNPQSRGFTEIDTFNVRYTQYMFAYDTHLGTMIIFQLSVPPIGPKIYTTPYLIANPSWAPGWVRFACFQWGGENFFLKTNIKEHDVNIDHIFDEPLDGTHPVGDDLPLSQTLTTVNPFFHDFAPYFLTFDEKDGAITFNRFHSDAKGWTEQASNLNKIGKHTKFITPIQLTVPLAKNQQMRKGVTNYTTYILVY